MSDREQIRKCVFCGVAFAVMSLVFASQSNLIGALLCVFGYIISFGLAIWGDLK